MSVAERKQRAADQTLKGVRATARDGTGQNPRKDDILRLVARSFVAAKKGPIMLAGSLHVASVSVIIHLKGHIRRTHISLKYCASMYWQGVNCHPSCFALSRSFVSTSRPPTIRMAGEKDNDLFCKLGRVRYLPTDAQNGFLMKMSGDSQIHCCNLAENVSRSERVAPFSLPPSFPLHSPPPLFFATHETGRSGEGGRLCCSLNAVIVHAETHQSIEANFPQRAKKFRSPT